MQGRWYVPVSNAGGQRDGVMYGHEEASLTFRVTAQPRVVSVEAGPVELLCSLVVRDMGFGEDGNVRHAFSEGGHGVRFIRVHTPDVESEHGQVRCARSHRRTRAALVVARIRCRTVPLLVLVALRTRGETGGATALLWDRRPHRGRPWWAIPAWGSRQVGRRRRRGVSSRGLRRGAPTDRQVS